MRTSIIFGPKRYVDFEVIGEDIRYLDHAEVALGGFYADPPSVRGRSSGGHRRWSTVAVAQAARHTFFGSSELRPLPPWDEEGGLAFPALRRLTIKTPEMLHLVPEVLGPTMGTRYLEASRSVMRRGLSGTPVALDPGGDLSDWRELSWVDRRTGAPVHVTTDPADHSAVLLQTLDEKVREYTRPPRTEPIDLVVVDPKLVEKVGRVSGVVDSEIDGFDDLDGRRLVLENADAAGHFRDRLTEMGVAEFSRRFGIAQGTAQGILSGRRPSRRTLERYLAALRITEIEGRTCALTGCAEEVTRPNARYCSPAHSDRAYRLRKRASPSVAPLSEDAVLCPGCGAELLGKAMTRGTCLPCTELVA